MAFRRQIDRGLGLVSRSGRRINGWMAWAGARRGLGECLCMWQLRLRDQLLNLDQLAPFSQSPFPKIGGRKLATRNSLYFPSRSIFLITSNDFASPGSHEFRPHPTHSLSHLPCLSPSCIPTATLSSRPRPFVSYYLFSALVQLPSHPDSLFWSQLPTALPFRVMADPP